MAYKRLLLESEGKNAIQIFIACRINRKPLFLTASLSFPCTFLHRFKRDPGFWYQAVPFMKIVIEAGRLIAESFLTSQTSKFDLYCLTLSGIGSESKENAHL